MELYSCLLTAKNSWKAEIRLYAMSGVSEGVCVRLFVSSV